MVRSLYARILAFQFLLLGLAGFLFWLIAVHFNVPEPMSLIAVGAICLLITSVVVGLLLHPVDQVLLAVKHLAAGEDVPMPALRGADGRTMADALARLRERGAAPAPAAAPAAPAPAPAPATSGAEIADVLNSLSEGVMILDMGLKPLYVNTALRQMASAEQVAAGTGQLADGHERYRHAFHARTFVPDQLAVVEEAMVKHKDRPRTDIIQLEHPRQFLRRYSAPLHGERHEQTGWLVSYQDITHEVEQDRLRQDFIANASHELRTPVTSVKVLLENLVDGAKDDPNVADEFLNDALNEIDRMHELVNDLLDVAALEAGRHNLQLTGVEVSKVIAEAVTTVAPQAKQREVKLESDLPAGELMLEADRSRLRQVLVNLVANAVKFTPAGGEVRVKAWPENGQVRFCISDTGIGIPAQDLPHIFDRFFRVTRGRSRLQGGSGLGLTIVKQAIDAHRGEINVESTEGQGTTIYITLPASQKEER